MTNQNNLENLANVLANLGVQTFNPESGTGIKVNMKSGNTFQPTDQQAQNSEQYETEYRDGVVKSVGDTLQYNDAIGTVKQRVVVTLTNSQGQQKDFEGIRTLKNSVGSTKTPVVVGQKVTLAVSKHKTDKTKAVYCEVIDLRNIVQVSDFDEFFAEPKKKNN